MNEHSQKEINSAQDNFKKYCKNNKMSCRTDSIYHDANSAGKGDVPRNLNQSTYKKNYDKIFPNSFKPWWSK